MVEYFKLGHNQSYQENYKLVLLVSLRVLAILRASL